MTPPRVAAPRAQLAAERANRRLDPAAARPTPTVGEGAASSPVASSPAASSPAASRPGAPDAVTRDVDSRLSAAARDFAQVASEQRHGVAQAQHGELRATSLVELRARAEDDSLDVVFQKHLADFRVAFGELRRQAPSVVFFGGARLKPEDRYYRLAQAFGASLVPRGIPPKTGAGPGAMHAVPSEFIAVREANAKVTGTVVQSVIDGVSRLADLSDQRTQGFNIKLPAEQRVSPSIEQAQEIQQFAFRKFALYENVRGVVVFPGGFGTIDELMEVLILKREGRTRDPIVLAGAAYWTPILDAWRSAAQRHGADLVGDLLDDVLVTDDPEHALDHIESHQDVRAFEDDPEELYARMVRELKLARYIATRQPTAVTFLGGERLPPGDPALALAGELARRLDEKGAPLRVGQEGQVKAALARAAGDVQEVLWRADARVPRARKPDVEAVAFSERIPHKEVLLRNSSAYVVLPCADRGKDELCSVLCQIQTGKLPRRPLVLVDASYWRPIVDAWKEQMLGATHAYIEPEDLELVVYASNVDEAWQVLEPAVD